MASFAAWRTWRSRETSRWRQWQFEFPHWCRWRSYSEDKSSLFLRIGAESNRLSGANVFIRKPREPHSCRKQEVGGRRCSWGWKARFRLTQGNNDVGIVSLAWPYFSARVFADCASIDWLAKKWMFTRVRPVPVFDEMGVILRPLIRFIVKWFCTLANVSSSKYFVSQATASTDHQSVRFTVRHLRFHVFQRLRKMP